MILPCVPHHRVLGNQLVFARLHQLCNLRKNLADVINFSTRLVPVARGKCQLFDVNPSRICIRSWLNAASSLFSKASACSSFNWFHLAISASLRISCIHPDHSESFGARLRGLRSAVARRLSPFVHFVQLSYSIWCISFAFYPALEDSLDVVRVCGIGLGSSVKSLEDMPGG